MFNDGYDAYCLSVLAGWPLHGVTAGTDVYCGCHDYIAQQAMASTTEEGQRSFFDFFKRRRGSSQTSDE